MLEIPTFLIGEHRKVRSRVHGIARRVLATGTWGEILEQSETVPLESVPGGIVVTCPLSPAAIGDNVVVCTLFESFIRIGGDFPDREEWYRRQAAVVTEGLDHFWFALCLLAAGFDHLPFMNPPLSGSLSRKNLSRQHLKKLFRWAEALDQNRHRTISCSGMPIDGWDGPSFSGMIGDIGHMDDAQMLRPLSMVERSRVVDAWLAAF